MVDSAATSKNAWFGVEGAGAGEADSAAETNSGITACRNRGKASDVAAGTECEALLAYEYAHNAVRLASRIRPNRMAAYMLTKTATLMDGCASKKTMSQIQLWFERKFEFAFPVEQYPNVCVRLRGTPVRLEEIVRGVSRDVLIAKANGKWSAQEEAGHLLDMEPLWLGRIDDFFGDGDTLTKADLTNRTTNEAGHNERDMAEILADFRHARLRLMDRIGRLQPADFARTRLHPRLRRPMRLVDHLYFVAEHDDHHLARIWEMIQRAR